MKKKPEIKPEPEPEVDVPPEQMAKLEESVMRKISSKFEAMKQSVSIGNASVKHGPKPPVKLESHIGRLANLKLLKGKLPTKIIVRLTGLSPSKTFTLGRRNGLNGSYVASTNNKFEVTDKNDICFFLIKASKNPELYDIISPGGLI